MSLVPGICPHPHHYFSSVDLFLLLILFLQVKTHSIIQSRAYDSQICRLCSAGQRPLLLNSCQKHLSNKETASTKINSKAENFCENLSRSATAQQMFHRTDRKTFGLSVFWLSNGNNYNTEFPGWEASFIMFLASFFFFLSWWEVWSSSRADQNCLGRVNKFLERFPLSHCAANAPHAHTVSQCALREAPMKGRRLSVYCRFYPSKSHWTSFETASVVPNFNMLLFVFFGYSSLVKQYRNCIVFLKKVFNIV